MPRYFVAARILSGRSKLYRTTSANKENTASTFFLDDVVPISEAKAHCSLESKLRERVNTFEFRSHHGIAQLSVPASEIYVDREFLFSVFAPVVT